MSFSRVLLFGDSDGLPQLLAVAPRDLIVGIVVAKTRLHDLDRCRKIAQEIGLPIFIQPATKDSDYPQFFEQIRRCNPDLILCNSYSMLIRKDTLDLVAGNAFNVHGALLPKNRGPNPVQWALIKGEEETGVTLHYMIDRLDAGDIVAQIAEKITPNDTWVQLRDRLVAATHKLLEKQIPLLLTGANGRRKQDESTATQNKRLNPDSPWIDSNTMSDQQVFDLIRAQVSPLAGAYIDLPAGRLHFKEIVKLEEIAILREKYAKYN